MACLATASWATRARGVSAGPRRRSGRPSEPRVSFGANLVRQLRQARVAQQVGAKVPHGAYVPPRKTNGESRAAVAESSGGLAARRKARAALKLDGAPWPWFTPHATVSVALVLFGKVGTLEKPSSFTAPDGGDERAHARADRRRADVEAERAASRHAAEDDTSKGYYGEWGSLGAEDHKDSVVEDFDLWTQRTGGGGFSGVS